jgi:hypothetical protein
MSPPTKGGWLGNSGFNTSRSLFKGNALLTQSSLSVSFSARCHQEAKKDHQGRPAKSSKIQIKEETDTLGYSPVY